MHGLPEPDKGERHIPSPYIRMLMYNLQDRSLGSVELHVSELACESSEDPRYLYASTGLKAKADPLRQDKGGSNKGTLHYTAEFIPSLNVKWEKFEEQDTEAHHLAQHEGNDDGGYASSGGNSSSDEDEIPGDVTISSKKDVKNAASAESVKSTKTTGTAGTNEKSNGSVKGSVRPEKKADTAIVMSHEELLAQRMCLAFLVTLTLSRLTKYRLAESGIIIFHVISGKLAKKARIEVLLDDGYWPCFSTLKARSTQAQFGYVGEGFMKELDFGRVWFRLNDGVENEKDDIIAECREDAKPFLQAALV